MFPNEVLQRWTGRTCLLLIGGFGMMGYHFANVRFLPLVAGFAILAGVFYAGQGVFAARRPLRDSGQHSAL